MNNKYKIAVVDDHSLFRDGIKMIINSFENSDHEKEFEIILQADNGADFIKKLSPKSLPDIVVLDVNMPEMNGYETCQWLKTHYPNIKVLACSMYDNETAIMRMLKCGAKGYVLKDIESEEFRTALLAVAEKGYYYSELVSGKVIHAINRIDQQGVENISPLNLNPREIDFLKYVSTEMTYKEIAEKMFVSPRTVDGYRDALLEKLGVNTRVGLVLYAIKNQVVTL